MTFRDDVKNRKFLWVAGLATATLLLSAGCSQTPPDTRATDEKAIRELENEWNRDFKAKDVDKVAGHYAENATLMLPAQRPAKGTDAIRAAFTDMFHDRNVATSCTTAAVEVAKSGDLAFTQGHCATIASNPKTGEAENQAVNYITVYRKQAGGSWKAVEDMLSPDLPKKQPTSVTPTAKKGKAKPVAKAKGGRHRK